MARIWSGTTSLRRARRTQRSVGRTGREVPPERWWARSRLVVDSAVADGSLRTDHDAGREAGIC